MAKLPTSERIFQRNHYIRENYRLSMFNFLFTSKEELLGMFFSIHAKMKHNKTWNDLNVDFQSIKLKEFIRNANCIILFQIWYVYHQDEHVCMIIKLEKASSLVNQMTSFQIHQQMLFTPITYDHIM